jgi:hypothetical protein
MKALKFIAFALVSIIGVVALIANIYPACLPLSLADLFTTNPAYLVAIGLPIAVVDTTRGRFTYERLVEITSKINMVKGARIIISADYLLSEQLITNGSTLYEFNLYEKSMQNTQADWPLQKGVRDNNVFICNKASLLLSNRLPGASNVYYQRYPSSAEFNAVTGAYRDLMSFYTGQWFFQIDTTIYVNGETTQQFLDIPVTQKTLATNENQYSGDAGVLIDPWPAMSGRSDNKLSIQLKQGTGLNVAALAPSGTQNVVSFYLRGYTLQNGESFMGYFTGEKNIDYEIAQMIQTGELVKVGDTYVRN